MAKLFLKPKHLLLGFLITTFCFLRFFHAIDWFSFNFDEEYQAFLAWSQFKDFHPIWIGVSASNFGFYLGPGFTYLNALLFKISSGDLAILAVFSPLLGIATTLSIYYITNKLFSKKAALFASVIYGFSALMNIFDRRFWNPTPIPIITIWLLFSLYQANKNPRWFTLTAALMAASLHVHLSLIAFWPLIIFSVLKNNKNIPFKTWLLSAGVYLLLVSPLIVFDLNHNYDNLLGPIRFLTAPKTSANSFQISTITGNFPMIWRGFSRIWFLSPNTTIQDEMGLGIHAIATPGNFYLSFLSASVLVWLFAKLKKTKEYRLLFFAIISVLLAYLIYPGATCEYFLLSFFTLFPIAAGLFFSQINLPISLLTLSIFVAVNSYAILTIDQTKYGLNARRKLIRETQTVIRNYPFSVEVAVTPTTAYPQYAGWCLMYRSLGSTPISCPADKSFGWILNDKPSDQKPRYQVILSEGDIYDPITPQEIEFQQGVYHAYLYLLP